MAHPEHDEIAKAFDAAVNMTPAALETWLATDDSKSVGWANGSNKHDPSGPESVGHHEGGRVVEIKRKKKAELTDQDYADMNKVAGCGTGPGGFTPGRARAYISQAMVLTKPCRSSPMR